MKWDSDKSGLELVLRTFELDDTQVPDEADLIRALAQRIREMLDTETDLLFSTLYRLDVLEWKINQVMQSPAEDPATGLARLVLERQKEKLKTRKEYGGRNDIPDPFNPV